MLELLDSPFNAAAALATEMKWDSNWVILTKTIKAGGRTGLPCRCHVPPPRHQQSLAQPRFESMRNHSRGSSAKTLALTPTQRTIVCARAHATTIGVTR
jgi:hypothetical protein